MEFYYRLSFSLCLRKMSTPIPTVSHASYTQLMVNIREQLALEAKAKTIDAQTSALTLASVAANIAPESILKAGEDRSNAIADILDMFDAVDHTLNPAALSKDLHAAPGARHVRLRAAGNARILLLEKQKWLVRNETDSAIYIAVSGIHGTTGEQIILAPHTVGPWETRHIN